MPLFCCSECKPGAAAKSKVHMEKSVDKAGRNRDKDISSQVLVKQIISVENAADVHNVETKVRQRSTNIVPPRDPVNAVTESNPVK